MNILFLLILMTGLLYATLVFINPNINIRCIFLFAYTQGLMVLIGIPSQVASLILELSIIIFFLSTILISINKKCKLQAPGIIIMIIYSVIVAMSILANNSSLINSLMFYRQIVIPYLFFLALVNYYNRSQMYISIKKMIFLLFVIQVFASIMKILVVGTQQEDIIGTMSYFQGAIATVYPMLIVGICIAYFLCYRNKTLLVYLLCTVGAMIIGFASAKRAVWLYLPVVVLGAYFLYSYLNINEIDILKSLKNAVVVIVIILISLYAGGRLIPTLNPEEEIGGSFNLRYIISYASIYSNKLTDVGMTFGRQNTTVYVIELITENIKSSFLGFGPDSLNRGEDLYTRSGRFGIRYGLTGFTFNSLSTGLVASLLIPLLFLKFAFKHIKVYRRSQNKKNRTTSFVVIVATLVFLIDYFTYSTAFIYGESIICTYYFLISELYGVKLDSMKLSTPYSRFEVK